MQPLSAHAVSSRGGEHWLQKESKSTWGGCRALMSWGTYSRKMENESWDHLSVLVTNRNGPLFSTLRAAVFPATVDDIFPHQSCFSHTKRPKITWTNSTCLSDKEGSWFFTDNWLTIIKWMQRWDGKNREKNTAPFKHELTLVKQHPLTCSRFFVKVCI